MLIIIAICLITIGFNWLSKKYIAKKISMANTAEQTVSFRKTYRILRLFIIVLFTIVIIPVLAYWSYLMLDTSFSNPERHIINMIIMVALTYSTMSLPISGLTIDKFDESRPFALYLRGFAKDDYEPRKAMGIVERIRLMNGIRPTKKDSQQLSFSEQEFYKALKEYLPVYSVGMTKELESPEGSKRIYLNDETWQRDVAFLISKASYVFVLVNPSDSCMWEIRRCLAEAMVKTVFFVDDEEAANTLREQLQSFQIPYASYNNIAKNTMVYYNQVYPYINEYNGYCNALAYLWGIKLSNDKKSTLLNIIALLFPLVGFILFLVKRKTRPVMSKSILAFSGIGLLIKFVLAIVGMFI